MATLRITGDDLVPDEITKLLGCPPTKSQVKGKTIRSAKTGRERIVKSGIWRLVATDCAPENLDAQVEELLSKLTPNLEVWSGIKRQFKIDLFCGFFMEETNEGAVISAATLRSLGERGIELSLDIYEPINEIEDDSPCPCGSGKLYRICCKPGAKSGSEA